MQLNRSEEDDRIYRRCKELREQKEAKLISDEKFYSELAKLRGLADPTLLKAVDNFKKVFGGGIVE